MKYTRFLVLFLSICLLLAACGGAATADKHREEIGYESESGYNEKVEKPGQSASDSELTSDSAPLTDAAAQDRKLIKTVHLEAETEDYDGLIPALEARIAALGGYVENRRTGSYSRQSRFTEMTVRIPADRLSEFLAHVGENANVLSSSEYTQDVTLQYSDTEAKITALETEQARLLELLAGANNLGEILEIEARLSDVTYELERYESRKRTYDNQITYATVTVNLREVRQLTPTEEPTVWQRITEGFAQSLEGVGNGLVDAFVGIVVNIPYLLIWVPLGALAAWVIRRKRRNVQKNRQSPPSETP